MLTEEKTINKENVRKFWDENPCGKKFLNFHGGTKEFFDSLEKHRYQLESHIQHLIPFSSYQNKKVLEIGCGLGTDGIQFAREGALYHAIDLTPTSIELTKKRFVLENKEGDIQQGDAENIHYPDNTFDLVYSHGVIHHTPNIEQAVSEIHRVLKPGGQAIIMVYHKASFNYFINIMLLRRIGIWLLLLPGGVTFVHKITGESQDILSLHKRDLKKGGFRYLSSEIFLSRNTDGAGNPLSRVYTAQGLMNLFSDFQNKKTYVRYFNKHRIPLIRYILPHWLENWISRRFGWHIYLFANK